ncbi:hypothetical protein JTB14_019214 [Gonioctena quinquepunctata]|nr:hypothetical protein JTB14_019214 [Gonioctena quinquepunctata]
MRYVVCERHWARKTHQTKPNRGEIFINSVGVGGGLWRFTLSTQSSAAEYSEAVIGRWTGPVTVVCPQRERSASYETAPSILCAPVRSVNLPPAPAYYCLRLGGVDRVLGDVWSGQWRA